MADDSLEVRASKVSIAGFDRQCQDNRRYAALFSTVGLLAERKVDIIAHEYAAADMRKMALMFTKPTGGGLPTRTFKDRFTVGSGPERLELYYFAPSHMRSDIFVVIPALRVLLTGDAFGGKFLPALSRVAGGHGVEYPNTLTRALPLTRNIDSKRDPARRKHAFSDS